MTLIDMQMLPYSDDVTQVQGTHDGIIHESLTILILICAQFMPLMFCKTTVKFWIIFFKQACLQAITL